MLLVGLLVLALRPGLTLAGELLPPPEKVAVLVEKHSDPTFPKVADVLAIIHVESVYKERARLGKARGLMQVNNGSYHPERNIQQGVELLKYLHERFGSRKKAIIAYNIGEGNFVRGRLRKRGLGYFNKVDKLSNQYSVLLMTE